MKRGGGGGGGRGREKRINDKEDEFYWTSMFFFVFFLRSGFTNIVNLQFGERCELFCGELDVKLRIAPPACTRYIRR